ncbi:unnamed protein product [marine sediment metagenome]|uniref:Uncharacterized protein n=1 Tax=marine sediment metagenome TaxID=412755 RepID=X1M3E4_9ZZZZ
MINMKITYRNGSTRTIKMKKCKGKKERKIEMNRILAIIGDAAAAEMEHQQSNKEQ